MDTMLPGVGEGLFMKTEDREKLHVIRNVVEKRIKQRQAAKLLGMSARQVRRLCRRLRRDGHRAVVHGLRGRPSNNQFDVWVLEQALAALHDPLWHDFGPTYAQDWLRRRWGICLGIETVRQLMTQVGLWEAGIHKPRHRTWRARRDAVGMLVQLDGSDHDWFEGRGSRCVLLIYIDDATSRILYGEFVRVEDTRTLLRTTLTYLRRHGRPRAFYVDKDSIYRVNRSTTVEEDLQGQQDGMTQFTRAMEQLLIEMIFAHSPQAKGRVERCHGTTQDRLVKALRLLGISDIPTANRYLWNVYIPEHNRRYAVAPKDPVNAHRPCDGFDLDAILALQTGHVVQHDWTVRHDNRYFQILRDQPVRVGPKDQVLVVERLDGSIQIVAKQRCLGFKELDGKPYYPAYYRHPKLRSVRRQLPHPFYGKPLPHSPLPGPFKSLTFDPISTLRRRVEREALHVGR